MIEQTLILIKPDAIKRGLSAAILRRFERAGFKFVGMKMVWINKKFAKEHYFDVEERRGKKVFKVLTDFITQGPVIAAVIEGVDVIENIRKMVGSTEPKSAAPGTIRGDYSHHSFKYADKADKAIANVIHASGDSKDAKREISLWFNSNELHSYKRLDEGFVF